MFAVVDDRNQQFRAVPGNKVLIALQKSLEPGSTITFDKVCLVGGGGDGGGEPKIGTPHVAGASVTAKVLGQVAGPKLVIQKFKRRKNQRRRTGFRAHYTEIQIEAIHV